MPDIEKATMTTNSGTMKPDNETNYAARSKDEESRLKLYRQVYFLLGTLSLVSTLYYLVVYQQFHTKLALAVAAVLLAAVLLIPIAFQLVKRGNAGFANALTLAAVTIAYGINEVVIKGLLPYHLVGGVLLITFTGLLLFQRKRMLWPFVAFLYIVALILIDLFPIADRFDASQSSLFTIYAVTVNVLIGLGLFLIAMLVFQRRSIRTRMILAFLLLVLLPIAITTTVASVLTSNTSQEQAINIFDMVIEYKEGEINNWHESLRANLLASIFQTGQKQQGWMLDSTMGWTVQTLVDDYPSNAVYYLDIYNSIREPFLRTIEQEGIFDEIFIVGPDGTIVLSTNQSREGTNQSNTNYFLTGQRAPYISPAFYSDELQKVTIVASVPLLSENGKTIALLVGNVDMGVLEQMMNERAGFGETGEIYLVSKDNLLITPSRFAGYPVNRTYILTEAVQSGIQNRESGSGTYIGYRGIPVLGVYTWIPQLEIVMVAEQEQSEALRPMFVTLFSNIGAALLSAVLAVIAAMIFTRRITNPLNDLAVTAEFIAGGNMNLTVPVEQEDEIGALAKSFNAMTLQLRELIGGLEQKVAERTLVLERRTEQLRAASEIARDATAVQDPRQLMDRAVNLIRERFGFYHAGLFLVDERNEYALLYAATGDAGQEMLAHGHKLKVGEVGIIGYVTGFGEPRIALDVGADAAHFKNPLLPLTRSEVGLPLRIGKRIIGALDVQSDKEMAFDEETIEVLQVMADQLAVAIENVRLLQSTQRSVIELERAYGTYTRDSWQSFLNRSRYNRGYRYRGLNAEPVEEHTPEAVEALQQNRPIVKTHSTNEGSGESSSLAVPMKLRGQTIGVVNLRMKKATIPEETMSLVDEIASRLSLALDNARLIEETKLHSEQLSLLQEVTAEAASHVDLSELFDAVTHRLIKGLSLDHCAVFMLDSNLKYAIVTNDMHAENQTAVIDRRGTRLLIEGNEAFLGPIRSHKSVVFYDAQENPITASISEYMIERNTQTLVVVPMVSRGAVIGLLTLECSDRKRKFDSDELSLADQISLQVTTAVDVARLFEQTKDRAERERLAAEVASRIRETLDIESVLQTAAKEIWSALKLHDISIVLGSDPNKTSGGELSPDEGNDSAQHSEFSPGNGNKA